MDGHPEALFTFNTVDLSAIDSFVAAETVVRSILEIGAHHFAQVEKVYILNTGSIQNQPLPSTLVSIPWIPDAPLTGCVLAGRGLETHIVVAGMFGAAGCYVSFPRSHIPAQADPARLHELGTEGVVRSREGRCAKCNGRGRLIKCSKCKHVKYCSKDCRRADKPAHERLCSLAQRIVL